MDQITAAQAFLPYVVNPRTGKTLYEELAAKGFDMLTEGVTP